MLSNPDTTFIYWFFLFPFCPGSLRFVR